MGILSWLIVGLIAGWIANMIMSSGAGGLLADILIGIVGAIVGGFIAGLLFGGDFVSGINFTTIIVAIIGACVTIALYRAVTGQRIRT
ncbi:MAG TPA: GlsB/YeaQ/YmgE family stress response membrane protein [Chloroflexia bacterium]|nr:GlsB/YeaQ/YmgE family stress response membrane protein [Chloroflexia bacterium]